VGRSLQLTSGEGLGHDEIDMEFMHTKSGEPVVLNTNVRANGDGKERQFYLWFDPVADYFVLGFDGDGDLSLESFGWGLVKTVGLLCSIVPCRSGFWRKKRAGKIEGARAAAARAVELQRRPLGLQIHARRGSGLGREMREER